MEGLTALKTLLCSFPQWGDQPLAVEHLENTPTACGLFPLGMQVRHRQEDVLGNVVLGLRQSFLLRRTACPGFTAAAWLMALQQWLSGRLPAGFADSFGKNLRIYPELGRLTNSKQPGTGIYEVKIHVDYEKEYEYGKY